MLLTMASGFCGAAGAGVGVVTSTAATRATDAVLVEATVETTGAAAATTAGFGAAATGSVVVAFWTVPEETVGVVGFGVEAAAGVALDVGFLRGAVGSGAVTSDLGSVTAGSGSGSVTAGSGSVTSGWGVAVGFVVDVLPEVPVFVWALTTMPPEGASEVGLEVVGSSSEESGVLVDGVVASGVEGPAAVS
ncbi:hypothetical protein [Mycobacterium antarcticum]|uniref:hypothetical protein n=1 Tax=unclassified Mycolicibacterium TaxID=2636767 RepID=UPI0032E9CDC1